jgi:hypothetical protein
MVLAEAKGNQKHSSPVLCLIVGVALGVGAVLFFKNEVSPYDTFGLAFVLLITWEFPRLCRGGSRSLTYAAVVRAGKLAIVET